MNDLRNTETTQQLTVAIDKVIKERKTLKVFSDGQQNITLQMDFKKRMAEAIQVANWAPFHYPANRVHYENGMDSPVPWRFHAIDRGTCQALRQCLIESGMVDVNKNQSIINMLSASGGLVLVTWLPEPGSNDETLAQSKRESIQSINDEHLAAAGAATQNLLLATEARDIQTYWSSGGVLKTHECYSLCGIPELQKLTGAIFMFPKDHEHLKAKEGKLRNSRGHSDSWMRWVELKKH